MPLAIRTPARLLAVSAAVLLAATTLAACSGTSADTSTQSKTDACVIVSKGLEAVQDQIGAANTALTSGDLMTVQSNLGEATASLTALAPQVTNAEISPILADLTAGLDNVRTAVTNAGVDDPASVTQALQDSAGDLQSAATNFNEACGN